MSPAMEAKRPKNDRKCKKFVPQEITSQVT